MHLQKITPCLWFDDQAEIAVDFYTGIFPDSRIVQVSRYGEAGHAIHGKPPGSVLSIIFELAGQSFTALNGGTEFHFSEATSFQVICHEQPEIDYFWNKLAAGGPLQAQQCGWLKDRFGLSWQIVPLRLIELISDPATSEATMQALLPMKKIDIAALQQAVAR